MLYVTIFLIAYLISAINPSIIIGKRLKGIDIRNEGSGNAGTTNAIRTLGTGLGILVFMLDIVKVLISYAVIYLLSILFSFAFTENLKSIYIVGSVIGHCYPIYYGFKGGKGVTTFLVSMMIVDYRATLVCLVVGLIIIALTRWVSLGSLSGVVLSLILGIFIETSFNYMFVAIAVLIICIRHRENIKRIINKTENKLSFRKK